jgi:MFS family permease
MTQLRADDRRPAGRARRRDFLGWRIVWALGATEIVNYGVLTYAFAVFIVPMQQGLGVSRAAVAGAFSAQLAAAALSAPAAGAWIDRHGPRGLMTAGSLAAAVLVVGWSQVSSVAALYVVFAALGVASSGVLYEPAFATVNAWFERDRNAALLALTVIAGFASTVFLPLAQALTDLLGWRPALLVLAGLVAATAVPHAVMLRRSPDDVGLGRDGGPAGPVRDEHAVVRRPGVVAPGSRAVRDALRELRVVLLTVASVVAVFATTAISVHLIAYLVEDGYPATVAAAAAGALGVLSVAGRVVLSTAARRVGLASLTAVMVGGWVPAVVALRVLPEPAGLVVFVLLFGAGFGVMTIARASLLADFVDPLVYGRTSGVQAGLLNVARVAAPVAVAWTRTSTGSYSVMLWLVGGCAAVAAAALLGCGQQLQSSAGRARGV